MNESVLHSSCFTLLPILILPKLVCSIWCLLIVALATANSLPSITLSGIPVNDPVAQCEDQQIVIPLKRAGNLFLIEAVVDSVAGDFIFDTGAPYLVLNQNYFRQLQPQQNLITAGVGNTNTAVRTVVHSLSFSGIRYNDIDVDLTDLSHIEDSRNFRLLGLLGTNLFMDFHVEVNMVTRQMTLTRLNAGGDPVLSSIDSLVASHQPDLCSPFQYCDHKIMMNVTVAGKKLNWMLDSGAETNVADVLSGKKVLDDFIVLRRTSLSGTAGVSQDVLTGILPELSIGKQHFQMQQTIVTSMREMNEACNMYIDGVLGYSFLSQGVYTLNFRKREFCIYLYNSLNR